MPTGYVIAESLRPGSSLEGLSLTLTRIERYAVESATGDQPSRWTMIRFEFREDDAGRLAGALADVLDEPGWYADFEAGGEKFVVFPRRIMRYRPGDHAARAEVEAYGRALGIPDGQLDF
jgi:hypothetical protein